MRIRLITPFVSRLLNLVTLLASGMLPAAAAPAKPNIILILADDADDAGIGDYEPYNTLVIFTSDNGPGAPGAKKDGSSGPHRGFKGTAWEGGNREPLVIKWPGMINVGITRADGMKFLAAFDPASAAYQPIEFYDLKRDSAEKRNILADPQHKPVAAELMAHLTTTLARDTVDRTTSSNATDEE